MKKSFILAVILAACNMGQVAAQSPPPIDTGGENLKLSLAESIDIALNNNNQIKSAESAREASKWGLSSVRRSTGATVGWESGFNRTRARKQGNYLYGTSYSNSWSLTIPIYTGGQLESQMDKNRYLLNQADLNLENVKQTIRYKTANAYANLLHQKDVTRIAQEAVEMSNSQLRLINDQYSEGAVAKSDVLMMEVRLANNRQNLVSAQGNMEIAKYNLVNAMGLEENIDVEPTDVFSYEPYPRDMSECEEYALEHRPDGIAAEYGIKVADANKNSAKSGYRPKISGSIGRGIAGEQPFGMESNDNLSAIISFKWNIFDNGVTAANVSQADALVQQSMSDAEYVKKNITLETRSAYMRMKTAETNLKEAAAALKQAEESYIIAQVRYEEGVDILLNLLDAQERLTQAKSNYSTALYNYNLYWVTLEKAMGVPVDLDVPLYVEGEQGGLSADKALILAEID
ncbi:TolC family protein [Anaerovibrio sp. RM50]|uniref:TolC family protein n=1 Tax=Anaerovibrio sp. RM50 TaxID=1200557 RepID=UPI0004873230|nr:TolC family protein [Anaerovibrio sp. RM50]